MQSRKKAKCPSSLAICEAMTDITRARVFSFIEANPQLTTKRDIARGLQIRGEDRRILRDILSTLEEEGKLARVGKRAFAQQDQPPPTGVVQFERIDGNGDLVGRCTGRDELYGPDIIYRGLLGRRREAAPGIGDRALCQIRQTDDGDWHARMIKRLVPARRDMIGVFEETRGGGGLVKPVSKKDSKELIILADDRHGAENGDIVRCDERKSKPHGPRQGVVKEVLGSASAPKAASLIAMAAHNIADVFPESVLDEVDALTPVMGKRTDLTQLPLLTIDPEDARDHDDAVFAEADDSEDNPGGWIVWVAIADVSAFVAAGSELDKEAYARSNSTYFPDRVAPMLPETLSAGDCSLRAHELRKTMAVRMVFDAKGKKRSHEFVRGTMKSAAKLSYEQAQAAIDGEPDDTTRPLLEPVLKPLWAAWKTVDRQRKYREPLDLDLPERRVTLDEDGNVTGITVRDRFDAHKLIEEFMIQANVCAAETLEARRRPLVYRVHPQPSDEKIHALGQFLATLDMKWTKAERLTPSRFNKLLKEARDGENEAVISEMVLRSQAQAIYSPENEGHFGLNLARYAHFTSPIRRYADLIVHRALIGALDLGPDGLSDAEAVRLEETASHLVERERASMAAERDATDRYLSAFLADKVGAEFNGRISGVAKFGLFVRLDETGADGFCPAARLAGDDYWRFDDRANALVGDRSGKRYELGQTVSVLLAEATPVTGGLLFDMLSAPRPGKKGDGGRAPAHARGKRGKPGRGSPQRRRR